MRKCGFRIVLRKPARKKKAGKGITGAGCIDDVNLWGRYVHRLHAGAQQDCTLRTARQKHRAALQAGRIREDAFGAIRKLRSRLADPRKGSAVEKQQVEGIKQLRSAPDRLVVRG